MTIFNAVRSSLFGIKSCLSDPSVRRYALKPWAVGFIVYILAGVGAVFAHGPLIAAFTSDPSGFWSHVVYWLIWSGVTLGLIAAASILGVVVVFAVTGVFQTGIVRHVLSLESAPKPPAEASGAAATAGEIGRTIYVEGTKLLWIVPFGLLILIGGFIPPLAPICFVLSAWLLAFESCDIVLDVYKIPVLKRLKLALGSPIVFTCFGAPFVLLSMIPLLGFMVPPLAAAGAARFLARHPLLSTEH